MSRDPAFLSPDARMRELAAILAQGVLRLGPMAKMSGESGENSHKSEKTLEDCLDVSAPSSPHGLNG